MCLLAYLLAVAAFMLAREYRSAAAYLGEMHRDCARIEQKIANYEAADNPSEFLITLRKEMDDAHTPRPSMVEVLAELTQLVDKTAWIQNFNWTDGQVELQLSTLDDTLDIRQKLEDSPILGDVVPGQKTLGHSGVMILRLQMNARYDVKGEARREPPPPKTAEVDRLEPSPDRRAPNVETDGGGNGAPNDVPGADTAAPGATVPPPPPPPPPPPAAPAQGDGASADGDDNGADE
jgi:hypothetical protein